MGKYLYQISDAGQILCRFAQDQGEEEGLRMDGFKPINEFSLEEKVNAAFIAASALDERIDSEVQRLNWAIEDLEEGIV